MIDRLGIIPAAGCAKRFGGLWKDELPIYDNVTLFGHTLGALRIAGCDDVLVVTSPARIGALAERYPECTYRIQTGKRDAWSAICESFIHCGRRNLYAMPDTYFNTDAFDWHFHDDFTMGYFETDKPWRFGMIRDKVIVDKQDGEPGLAWGVVVWSARVVEMWLDNIERIETHTQAFNLAIREFGLAKFALKFYYDCADMESYREILSHV